MLIGKDFDKVEFELFGLNLLEPNALIGDTILFFIALYLAYRVSEIGQNNKFNVLWKWFFIIFGVSFLLGGLGHSMYNYWGIKGKYASWYCGIISTFLIEQAMISIHPNSGFINLFKKISSTKLIVALFVETVLLIFVDTTKDPSVGLLVPLFNSTVGLLFSLGYLGSLYSKKISSFKYLWISVLILIPSTIFQLLKINFYPLFDRNDVAHVLLIASLICYYKAIKGKSLYLNVL